MKVSIIGAAGTLGSCAAFNIIIHHLVDEILLIDPWADVLTGHCLDLNYAATGSDILVRQGTYADMVGSDIVVITAGAPSGAIKSRSELLPSSLPIIKECSENINRYCPEAIVITETNPVDPLNYAMYLMSRDRDRRKFIGYSMNDSIRFKMWVAEVLDVKSSRIDGVVLGEHGNSQVQVFSSIRLDGKPIILSEENRQWVRRQPAIMLETFENLIPKRTAGWVSAVGTASLINAVKNNTGETLPCSVVLDGEYNCSALSMSVPVVIGKNGIQKVQILELADEEKLDLQSTIKVLTAYMRQIESYLGIKP
jgi:malate dehydrogenase